MTIKRDSQIKILTDTYADNQGPQLSVRAKERNEHHDRESLIYGEINFDIFLNILSKHHRKTDKVFCDLGSGAGKAVATAAMSGFFEKVNGVELVKNVYDYSLKKINLLPEEYIKDCNIIIKNADLFDVKLTNADIIFANSTCFSKKLCQNLIEKFSKLKKDSRVIFLTKPINVPFLELKEELITKSSWGQSTYRIYQKI
jgi:predicted RNA methylase